MNIEMTHLSCVKCFSSQGQLYNVKGLGMLNAPNFAAHYPYRTPPNVLVILKFPLPSKVQSHTRVVQQWCWPRKMTANYNTAMNIQTLQAWEHMYLQDLYPRWLRCGPSALPPSHWSQGDAKWPWKGQATALLKRTLSEVSPSIKANLIHQITKFVSTMT